MRFLFGLSATLNFLLLTTIVAARVDSNRDATGHRSGNDAFFELSHETVQRPSARQIDAVLELVAQSSMDPANSKILILGWLIQQFENSLQFDEPRYWQPGYSPQLAAMEKRFTIEQRVRESLIDIFGPEAASDPMFDRVFRPLGVAYGFLDSGLQLDFQRIQLELLSTTAELNVNSAPRSARCFSERGDPARSSGSFSLPASFSVADQREYALRFSLLAQQLRASGIAGDELEFRELFDRFQGLEFDASPERQALARGDLRAMIGDSEFDRLWSQRDPFYEPIREFLSAEGYSDHLVDASYSVVNRAQEAMLKVMGEASDPESVMSAIGGIKQDESAQLVGLLGNAAATRLAVVMNQSAMRINDTSAEHC